MVENNGAAAPNALVVPDDHFALISDPDPGRGFERDRLLADDLLKGADAIAEFMGTEPAANLPPRREIPPARVPAGVSAVRSEIHSHDLDRRPRAARRRRRGLSMSILRNRLRAACDANGVTQKSVTVLVEHRDPYRLDPPAMHLGPIHCRQSLGEHPAPDFPA